MNRNLPVNFNVLVKSEEMETSVDIPIMKFYLTIVMIFHLHVNQEIIFSILMQYVKVSCIPLRNPFFRSTELMVIYYIF